MTPDSRSAAWPRAFICLGILLLSTQVASEEVYSTSTTSRKSSSVLSLFNVVRTSKKWTDRILSRSYEDMELSESRDFSKKAVKNYTDAGRISLYLNLTEIDAIYLPVPLNFIFIGFDGHGNHDVKLREREIERWFTSIDHVLEHTRIPQLGDALTPFYRLGADGEPRHHLPLVSFTHYNYSVHAIELDKDVTEVFEHAIRVLSRKENASDSRPDAEVVWQVDMDGMAYIFDSLTHYLNLDDAYNVFILNPKRNDLRRTYGYRRGLSEPELKMINVDPRFRGLKGDKQRNPLDIEKFKKSLYDRHPMIKFSWTPSHIADMQQWTLTFHDILRTMEETSRNKKPEELVLLKAKQILGEKHHELANSLKKDLNEGKESDLKHECLVDAWIGHLRWAFLDLTAGPFLWGPTVGGEGVRNVESLPSVENLFGSLAVKGEAGSDEDHNQQLQTAMQDRFASVEEGDSAVDMLLAEMDVYEMFAEQHCRGRKIKVALCQELQERMDDVKEELDSFRNENHDEEHQRKALEALKRVEKWDMFGDIHEHVQNFSVARDSFLAHLGATLAGSMRHVITPSTAEGAFHYYERVFFQLYVVTQERAKNVNLIPLDVTAFKEAVSSLAQPSQTFHYSVNMLALSEDPALAMAFSVARRAAVLPVLLMNGTYKLSTRHYIDSSILQHQLEQLNSRNMKTAPSSSKATLEVPVFWFIKSEENAIFIDKHYLAKALPDMVIVVQSSQTSFASHLQCNGKSILWDPSSPMKAAVAAVAEHLSGLMPSHLTFSHAHDNADEDWTWSAGSHPFSSTSNGYKVSSFQKDAMARSYIITALDESVQAVNRVIDRLSREPTYADNFRAFKSKEHSLVREYNSVVDFWRRIAGSVGELKFKEAVGLLSSLKQATDRLELETDEVMKVLHPIHCTVNRQVEVPAEIFAGSGLLFVALVLWFALRPKRLKPKIN